jgi:ABC-2 type transport system ATP-binding protein
MNLAIITSNLSRIYKIRSVKKGEARELAALQDINLEIQAGELFGLLGPNGAGKTTLIKILTTLLSPTTGKACVAGYDVSREPGKVRQRINMVSGGESSGYGLLTVRENLWMFSQFYGIPSGQANRRIKELLEIVGLADRMNSKSSDLSTGLRQKMNIVRGFMTDPEVLFLDEPTLGLDVGASREVRHFIRKWVKDDPRRTILLTTHYMVEADELCDRVAIINQGRVLSCDVPETMKRNLQHEALFRIEVSSIQNTPIERFSSLPGVKKIIHLPEDGYSILELVLTKDDALSAVVNTMTQEDIHILNLQKHEPTLEDVFVDLVGRSMEEVELEHSDEEE